MSSTSAMGTEPQSGRAAIVDFFAVIAGMEETTTELMWCKVAADTAVFQFRLRAVWDPVTDLQLL